MTTSRNSYTVFFSKDPFLDSYGDLERQQTSPCDPQQTLPCDQQQTSPVLHNKCRPVPHSETPWKSSPTVNLASAGGLYAGGGFIRGSHKHVTLVSNNICDI